MIVRVDHLLIGAVAPLGHQGALSGIDKRPSDQPLFLSPLGLTGDAQGDRRFHGGVDKALHHYPREHYDAWRAEGDPLGPVPGGFGENLSTRGLTEADVAVGDVFRLGEAVVAVTQGRQPCWKLNLRFGHRDMARRVQASGRIGWYYRVVEPGLVRAGDSLERLERPWPDWTIERLWRILYVRLLDPGELTAMAALEVLPDTWRAYARERLRTGLVENWTRRLDGP
ncbi:MOSC domain-containing protein [Caulobacter sp. RHG1]|uniref:MOSC domain-containing protein n=1 Tax=Caulobacter sp. (strain RHG1) TaxID=2545762 RepID=UPI0018852467|nr:MOSC domain-containing protein [Caulobacter sp. RHG1]NQE61347.1 hypothetical protein [Caulobacter sp. RHG1]